MNVVDIVIIILLGFGFIIGFRQGFTQSLFSLVGFTIVIVLAFILKNPVSQFLMMNLPFFDFWGVIKGLSVLNIAFYEVIGFLIVAAILTIILRIILRMTTIFEKVLEMTIILGFPSKVLGGLVGIIRYYLIVFSALYILSLPNFAGAGLIIESKFNEPILKHTPILSIFASKTLNVIDEFADLRDKYENTNNSNQFNLETLDLFLKYDIVKPETVKKLIEKDKLHINGALELIEKYEEEK